MRVENHQVGLHAMTAILAFAATTRFASAAAVGALGEIAQTGDHNVFDPRAQTPNNPDLSDFR